jgi:hypothetical protein
MRNISISLTGNSIRTLTGSYADIASPSGTTDADISVPSNLFNIIHKSITTGLRKRSEYCPSEDGLQKNQTNSIRLANLCEENRDVFLKGISNFISSLEEIKHEDTNEKAINYVGRLAQYVKLISDNSQSLSSGDDVADHIDLVISETLSYLVSKLSRHPDDNNHKQVAEKIVTALHKALPKYFGDPDNPYHQLMPRQLHDDGKRVVTKIKNSIHKQQQISKSAIKEITFKSVDEAYITAGQLCVNATKPKHTPYDPSGERCDYHSHQSTNYDPHHDDDGYAGTKWADKLARALGIKWHFVMPIPHNVVTNTKDEQSQPCGKYYLDHFVKKCCHANKDSHGLQHTANAKKADLSYTGRLTSTGLPIAREDWTKVIEDAKEYAENYALICAREQLKVDAKEYNIGVVFGEITINKTQLPQPLISSFEKSTGKPFPEMAGELLKALYASAQKGIQNAIAEKQQDKVARIFKSQIRIVLHCDTTERAGNTKEARTMIRKVPSKNENKGVHGKINKDQPTISDDILQIITDINQTLSKNKASDGCEYVLQLAHLAGVDTENHSDDKSNRTNALYELFKNSREFEHLRVVADTSWLTAAARYVNRGMGRFLKSYEKTADVGVHLIKADDIANEGFMFLSGGERYFQNRIAAGDRSPETIHGMALMRASIRKIFESYYRELGGIKEVFAKNGNLGQDLMAKIKEDVKKGELEEGNFIGLLYKLHEDHKETKKTMEDEIKKLKNEMKTTNSVEFDRIDLQIPEIESKLKNMPDAIPFVWGSDGLTQFSERSGAEKFKLYRDQLAVESLMEMMIDSLSASKGPTDKKDAATLIEILNQLRMGQTKDQYMFSPRDTDIPETNEQVTPTNRRPIAAAHRPVAYTKPPTMAQFYEKLKQQRQ